MSRRAKDAAVRLVRLQVHSRQVLAGIVSALGITQIIGYGTLYYSFSILAPGMAADLGLSLSQVFGVFSVSLFIGGLSATYLGRQMDRIGAATIMTIGSVLAALTLALCAWSPSVAVTGLHPSIRATWTSASISAQCSMTRSLTCSARTSLFIWAGTSLGSNNSFKPSPLRGLGKWPL